MTSTAWLLISMTLLLLTLPGVALFYGGMVRKKNVLSAMALPLVALVLASLEWPALAEVLPMGAELWTTASGESGRSSLVMYYSIACALALGLVAGAVVERLQFSFFVAFGLLWVAVVFGPVAQWLWGGGWLTRTGALDFAGGAVIHVAAGVTALALAILVGPRKGYGRIEMMPHHLPLSFCGASFMCVGWFGFSSGMGRAPITVATSAIVAIQVAAASAALAWTAAEWLQRDKPTMLGTVSGAIAGLVAISAGAGYVGPLSAMVIGLGAGGLCYMVVNFVKPILGYDDSLDVFGMHGVGGTWGMIATGLFASSGVNPDSPDGLFFGYPYPLAAQLAAVGAVWAYAGVMTVVLYKALTLVLPSRVEDEEEVVGLDLSLHNENAYWRGT
jgi:Amt family ammonium transporter